MNGSEKSCKWSFNKKYILQSLLLSVYIAVTMVDSLPAKTLWAHASHSEVASSTSDPPEILSDQVDHLRSFSDALA